MTVLPSQYADPFATAASQDDLLSHETATSKVAFDELRVEVAVIGAGVVGLAVSRRLAAEDGRKVLIIETGAPTFGTSMANAGHVAGSYVLPFARPGVVRSGLASLLRHDGAFAFNARHLGIVVPWLVGFVRSCSEENVRRALPALVCLANWSDQGFEELAFANEDLLLRSSGILEIYYTSKSLEEGRSCAVELEKLDVRHREVDPDDVVTSSPLLRVRPAGALCFDQDRSLDPAGLWRALRADALSVGTGMVKATARRILRRAGSVRVETDMGTVVADRVVVAAGAWSRMLLDDLGVHLNLAAAKGYSITVQGPQDRLATPMVLMEPHLALNPLPQGLRISSRYEVTSPGDRRLDGARLRKLVRSASLHLEIGANPEIAYAWTGNRPAMADGFPVIGPVPSAPEVIVCTGHGMIGTTTALGSAVLVAHLIAGRPVPPELAVLGPGRPRS